MSDFNLNGPTGVYEDRVYRDWDEEDFAEDAMQERKRAALAVCREAAAKLLNIHGVSKEIREDLAHWNETKSATHSLEDYVAAIIHTACESFTYDDSNNDDYLPETE